jgi:aspartate oxidase
VRLAQLGAARVGVLTKGELEQSTTRWAQGGIAAVLAGDEDSTDLHLADTLRAGAGLCDRAAVRVLVDDGPMRVHELIALGAVFDRVPGGELSRAREGGHSTARVLHAGGTATGAEVERALVEAVRSSAAAILEGWFALDLVVEAGRCADVQQVEAAHVVLACGGAGQMYAVTTNPREATGDGIAMALRAGVPVADMEFMQFHPTALHHPAMPRPLISEALRGHGAVLRDLGGDRFVDELLPRDIVSRAIALKLAEEGGDHVWLDATALEDFANRFPTIAVALGEVGLDPALDWLPVAPAAHYLSGGVLVNLDGATALPGLWAAGEVACTGVHGANRLASNSLLEGMVFGARCVDAVLSRREVAEDTGALAGMSSNPNPPADATERSTGEAVGPIPVRPTTGCQCGAHPRAAGAAESAVTSSPAKVAADRSALQAAMTSWAGVVRSSSSLAKASEALSAVVAGLPSTVDRASAELRNLTDVARALLEAATSREETRGSHARSDFPETSPAFLCRLAHGSIERAEATAKLAHASIERAEATGKLAPSSTALDV